MTPCYRTTKFHHGLLMLTTLAVSTVQAENAACKAVLDAELKYVTTPNHTISTLGGFLGEGAGQRNETINTGKRRYVLVDGVWRVNPVNDVDALQLELNKRQGQTPQCRMLREEPIGGEAATLYLAHNVTPGSTWDEQIWISNRSRLPLKVVVDFPADGEQGGDYLSSRIFYDGVRAPAGLR